MKAGTLDRPSICIWVEKAPKSEKIAEKCTYIFETTENAMQTLRNKGVKHFFFAQVCRRHIEVVQKDNKTHHQMVTTEAQWREKHQPSRARVPPVIVFFCCHICHSTAKNIAKNKATERDCSASNEQIGLKKKWHAVNHTN